MRTQTNRTPQLAFLGGLIMILAVMTALVLLSRYEMATELMNVMMLILGMIAVTAVIAFVRVFESANSGPLVSITFNEGLATSGLRVVDAEVFDVDEERKNLEYQTEEEGEFSAAALAGRDNQLALAKLRMDLERETRAIARQHRINEAGVPFNPRLTFEDLVSREIIPFEYGSAWSEVFSACNKAIHGVAQVDDETTESIIRVGMKLIVAMRKAANKRIESNG